MAEEAIDRVLQILGGDKKLLARAPCGHTYRLTDSPIFYGDNVPKPAQSWVNEMRTGLEKLRNDLEKLKNRLKSAEQKSVDVQFGKTVEKIIPVLSGFPYSARDCRPLFDPIDYIAFKGWSNGRITRVDFIDVKSGGARLSSVQRRIRDTVLQGKVTIEEFRP